jgi:hypothetical protein
MQQRRKLPLSDEPAFEGSYHTVIIKSSQRRT